MLRRLEYFFLVGSIALIGADRVDLFAGHAPFRVTPFLVLASLFCSTHVLIATSDGRFSSTTIPAVRRQRPFLFALSVFLFCSAISTIFGLDPERGLVAMADLLLVSILGYCVAVRIAQEPEQQKLIVQSVAVALLVYFCFCVAECISWSHGITQHQVQQNGPWAEGTFAPDTVLWVPRLSGPTVDCNRAGFVLVMYLALLDAFAPKSRLTPFLRGAIAVFVLLTLSRSAVLCWLVYYLFSKSLWSRLATWRGLAWLTVFAIVCSLVAWRYQEEISQAVQVWEISDVVSARVSADPGSSGLNHLELIKRGIATWSDSTRSMLTGIGFAAAPKVLGDFFGDDKYGNFHCLYVTILAELGLPAFVVFMALFYPIFGRKGTLACVAAMSAFNLAYQSHLEPVFWLLLALLWSFAPKHRRILEPMVRGFEPARSGYLHMR